MMLACFVWTLQKPDVAELGLMAASELIAPSSDDAFDRRLQAVHGRALLHFRPLAGQRVRLELEPVVRRFGLHSPQGAGAAYVMAMHGVDVAKNAHRLALSGSFPFTWDRWGVAETVPVGLGDIYLKSNSPYVARELIALESDAAPGETQAEEMAVVFERRPEPIMRLVLRQATLYGKLVSLLAMGDEWNIEGSNPHPPSVAKGIRKLLRIRSLAAAARRLAADVRVAKS